MTDTLRYRAFISYSHQDSRMATRLHRKLESYRPPKKLSRPGSASSYTGKTIRKGKISPVFRDRDDLATAESLSANIEKALDESEALIIVCSPSAVASRWVNKEIHYFRKQHPQRPVLAFVANGDPTKDPVHEPDLAAFPINLLLVDLDQPDGRRLEPLAADARQEGDGFHIAFLKLTAGLLGVYFDVLRNREMYRRQRRWALVGSFSLLLTVVFAVLAWRATVARNEARVARSQAELELLSERQTRNFLLNAFTLADPNETRGSTVTVREVLDSAVARIDSTEFARPVIKARFLATMGQAYSSLGLNFRSTELLRESLDVLPDEFLSEDSWIQKADSQIELSDVLFSMGEYDQALALLDEFDSDLWSSHVSPQQAAQAANIRGDILSYQEQDDAAMLAYKSALEMVDQLVLPAEENASIRSRSLGGIAILHHFAGEYGESQQLYREAVELLLPIYGERHPDTIWAMISWGSAAYSNGDASSAKRAWSRSLSVAREVLGETHPEVGTVKNNLARLLLETGDYVAAEELLRDALAIDRQHRGKGFDDLAYPLNNLALVRLAQGDVPEAIALWREALPVAEASGHRMLGPILTGLADALCATGLNDEGAKRANRAMEATLDEFGETDWRRHSARLTSLYCQAKAYSAVVDDISLQQAETAYTSILDRWGEGSYFTRRAAHQLAAIRAS
jgi:tetratricopeptide (TPR) repeat protein